MKDKSCPMLIRKKHDKDERKIDAIKIRKQYKSQSF